MAISNNTYLDYDGLKVYTQALLGKFALLAKTPELDSNGIIKSQYLPSYVDDVVEYANRAAFPSVGDKSKLYLAQDTGDIYRWTGTQYINMLSADGIAAQAAKVTNALKFGSKSYDGSLAQTITKADLGLGNVENVALSTWKGSTNITTLGVITTGTWHGTKIANAYLANSSITIGTTKFNLGDAKTAIEGLTSLLFSGASGALTYNKTDKYYSLADNLVVNGILASGTSGTGGGDGYSQVEWADIQKMTGSVSGSLASAYAVKESYTTLKTTVDKKADKVTLDAVTTRVTLLENKYTAVTTDIANHIGNTTVHITSAERTAWNNKQAAISDLATIRSNAATAYGWGDHSEVGYITGITKAMVESVLTGNITSHTHSYIPLADKGLSGGKVPYYVIFPSYDTLVSLGYNEASTVTEDEYYFKGLCKWAIDNFSNQGYLILTGNAQPNSIGYCRIELYSNHGKDANTGLPRYCSGTYLSLNNVTTNFVCRNYMWSWGGTFNGDASTASKWTNARTITLTGSVTGSVSLDGSGNVSLDTTTNHTHTFASLTSKPTTLSGYGITDASRIFRYTIPVSGNKGVRITFTSHEPVKITVSGENGNAQLMLVGTGYGAGGFLRNNFTELVQSFNYYTWCLADENRSVEVFSTRAYEDVVTVESPSPVTFTAISALSKPAAYRHLLTSANYSSYALPLTGGIIRGSIELDGDYPSIVPFVRNFKSEATGGWSRAIAEIRVDNKNAFRIAAYGSYTPNAENNKIQYAYLGFAGYNGLNLRISDTSLSWGNNVIYHAGNCNLSTIPWTCSSLTANGSVEAKANLYGQSLKFSNISSSANHGGYIDFHFNGSTANYTSRIIEDAAGQLTLRAGTINIGTAAKCFLYLQRPSVNYIWANTKGGEICIGTADGGGTSELNSGINIIGKRVYIGGTVTGNNALNVAGVAHATTGIYTDGYISARRQDTASDIKLKKDFRKIDNALKYVLNTHYTRFRWKDDDKESIGIIAQEEQNREYGFLVQDHGEIGHLTYDYAASTALLGAAIQEEDSKVEKLRKRIIKLENELSNLKKKWQH